MKLPMTTTAAARKLKAPKTISPTMTLMFRYRNLSKSKLVKVVSFKIVQDTSLNISHLNDHSNPFSSSGDPQMCSVALGNWRQFIFQNLTEFSRSPSYVLKLNL